MTFENTKAFQNTKLQMNQQCCQKCLTKSSQILAKNYPINYPKLNTLLKRFKLVPKLL